MHNRKERKRGRKKVLGQETHEACLQVGKIHCAQGTEMWNGGLEAWGANTDSDCAKKATSMEN